VPSWRMVPTAIIATVMMAPGAAGTDFLRLNAENCAAKFEECAGDHGDRCCQAGCTCMEKTKFYSQCTPPEGSDECDVLAAADSVKVLKSKIVPLKDAEEKTKKRVETLTAEATDMRTKANAAQDASLEAETKVADSATALASKADEVDGLVAKAKGDRAEYLKARKEVHALAKKVKAARKKIAEWSKALKGSGLAGDDGEDAADDDDDEEDAADDDDDKDTADDEEEEDAADDDDEED